MATSRKAQKPLNIYQAYKDTFDATQAGKDVLSDLEKAYHLRQSFSNDPHMTAFKEGQRSVYLRIIHMMENDGPSNDPSDDTE